MEGIHNNKQKHSMIFILFAGFISIIVCIYYCFSKFRKNTYYDEMKIMRHDIKEYVDTIYLYLKSQDYAGAEHYIESLDAKVKKYGHIEEVTKNRGLNATLTKFKSECSWQEIEFNYFILADVEKMNDMDLGILLTNVLNNAVEACRKKKDDRKITMTITNYMNYLHIVIENSLQESELDKNPNLKTTKKDNKIHGFGLKSIGRIIDKYDGGYKIKEENGMFVQEIYLKL